MTLFSVRASGFPVDFFGVVELEEESFRRGERLLDVASSSSSSSRRRAAAAGARRPRARGPASGGAPPPRAEERIGGGRARANGALLRAERGLFFHRCQTRREFIGRSRCRRLLGSCVKKERKESSE